MKAQIKLQDNAWFALSDTDSCRLLCCGMTRRGKYHVEEYETLVNTLPEQEHQRPMTNAGAKHNAENKERRFADEIVSSLEKNAKERDIGALTIFATARMLGLLQTAITERLSGLFNAIEGNLMHLKVYQLADHPMVRELARSMGSDRRAVIEAANLLRNAQKKRNGRSRFEGGA